MKKSFRKENDFNQIDILAEESIYKNFLSNKNSKIMKDFMNQTGKEKYN